MPGCPFVTDPSELGSPPPQTAPNLGSFTYFHQRIHPMGALWPRAPKRLALAQGEGGRDGRVWWWGGGFWAKIKSRLSPQAVPGPNHPAATDLREVQPSRELSLRARRLFRPCWPTCFNSYLPFLLLFFFNFSPPPIKSAARS